MTILGYALACGEFHPNELVRQAVRAQLAGGIGDGYQCSMPEAGLVSEFHHAGGMSKPAQAGFKVCYGPSKDDAVRTAHELCASEQLPGELGQNLPTPTHFEQASSLVTTETVEQSVPAGLDAKLYLERIKQFADAGFDEVYVQQIGDNQDEFFAFWESQIAPELAA